jgi:D-alanyl-D-alanine carboxypeptidase
MASTTKIMTALLLIELVSDGVLSLTDVVTVSRSADCDVVGGSKAGLHQGDTIEIADLLYGLMLPSGNDCAVAIAEHVTGEEGGLAKALFAEMMNERAEELGLANTHFVGPWGGDPEDWVAVCDNRGNLFDVPACAHHATARDLATLARFALNEPLFATVVNTRGYQPSTWIGSGGLPVSTCLCNSNRLIRDGTHFCSTGSCGARPEYDPRVYGVKTGTTDRAVACLVTSAADGGRDIITVVLGSNFDAELLNRWTDSATLIDFGFAAP